MARAFGLKPSIQLYGMGGLTSWTTNRKFSPGKSILISIAGPGIGILFGFVILAIYFGQEAAIKGSPVAEKAFEYLLWVNFGWGILNLLPILPLDGGNVAQSIEEWLTGKPDGIFSHIISFGLASLIAVWALTSGQIWILFLTALFAFQNGRALYHWIRVRRDQHLQPLLESAMKALQERDGSTAVRLAQQVIAESTVAGFELEARQIMIQGYILEGNIDQARAQLLRYQARFGPNLYLEALVLMESGEAQQAVSLLAPAFAEQPSAWLGLLLGEAYLKAGRLEEALALSTRPEMAEVAQQMFAAIQAEANRLGAGEIATRAAQLLSKIGNPTP
jgi:hypothetical protein